MWFRVFVGCLLLASCAAPRPPAATAQACLRMDERAGVSPSARRACWDHVAANEGPMRAHAAARAAALAGATTEGTTSDAPARLRLAPAPAATLPTPAPAAAPPPDGACAERAAACDAACAGSSAWATCLARCDDDLARCLQP
jgi:hypothetical protein